MSFLRSPLLCIALVLTYSFVDVRKSNAQTKSPNCSPPSVLLDFIKLRIEQSRLATYKPLSCVDIKTLTSTNPSSIELTTGRKNGEPVICIGTSRDYPCQYVVGVLKGSLDPTSALASIFSVSQRDPDAPLNETVERLFIRPAALIR